MHVFGILLSWPILIIICLETLCAGLIPHFHFQNDMSSLFQSKIFIAAQIPLSLFDKTINTALHICHKTLCFKVEINQLLLVQGY